MSSSINYTVAVCPANRLSCFPAGTFSSLSRSLRQTLILSLMSHSLEGYSSVYEKNKPQGEKRIELGLNTTWKREIGSAGGGRSASDCLKERQEKSKPQWNGRPCSSWKGVVGDYCLPPPRTNKTQNPRIKKTQQTKLERKIFDC